MFRPICYYLARHVIQNDYFDNVEHSLSNPSIEDNCGFS